MRHVADFARVEESPLLVRREKLPVIEAHAVICRWNGERQHRYLCQIQTNPHYICITDLAAGRLPGLPAVYRLLCRDKCVSGPIAVVARFHTWFLPAARAGVQV